MALSAPTATTTANGAASAINQLQAFALSAPEAAAAAAAAAVTFTPFYASARHHHAVVTPTNHMNLVPAADITHINGIKMTNSVQKPIGQKQRKTTTSNPKTKTAVGSKKSDTSNNNNGNKQQTTGSTTNTTTLSRSQRRYAGRASCDCPNCLDLERLRRLGLEPPATENTNGNEQPMTTINGKKLMHICHHAGCGKEYEKTSHLRAHLRWHTSERMSACRHADCGMRFSRTDELRKHMKTHHSQQTSATTAKTTPVKMTTTTATTMKVTANKHQ